MQYHDYSIEELAAENSFISWCLGEDDEQSAQWEAWIANNPDRESDVRKAKAIVLNIQKSQLSDVNSAIQKEAWKGISNHINTTPKSFSVYRSFIGKVAAVLILGLISFYFLRQNSTGSSPQNWIVQENTTSISKSIMLSDSTIIDLAPLSQIEYPSNFTGDRREVILKGTAFFDVTKDAIRPFVIYANETITKVLGTSFTIKAKEGENAIEVDVKTGKVEVYSQVDDNKTNGKRIRVTDRKISILKPNKKITVTPNQKVIVNKEEKKMEKYITDQPQIFLDSLKTNQYLFRNEPVAEVFYSLEKIYGVDISFDAPSLKSCLISAQLNKESLRTNLEMICFALDLKVKEENAIFKITGKGCKE